MADKEKYIIKVDGKTMEVAPDVYCAYFHMERQERGQEEKKQRNGAVSYDALDNAETVGLERFSNLTSPSMEEMAMTREIHEKLHRAVDALPKGERGLIQAIYFIGLTEKEYAAVPGLTQQGVSYRLKKILTKLKTLSDFMGTF